MDDPTQANALAATFPAPPPFYQSFTPENVKKIASLRLAQSSSKQQGAVVSLPIWMLDLPTELRYLQPPEPPSDGKFRCFGDLYDLKDPLPSLEAMGVEQVYSAPSTPSLAHSPLPSQPSLAHHDRAFILKRLAKSLLLNFLELVGIMSINPSQYPEKVHDIRTLFVNFHHLLNEYRPHQARESLILMMREQLEMKRAEVRNVRECGEKVNQILEGLGAMGLVDDEEGNQEDDANIEADVWAILEREFG